MYSLVSRLSFSMITFSSPFIVSVSRAYRRCISNSASLRDQRNTSKFCLVAFTWSPVSPITTSPDAKSGARTVFISIEYL